MNDRASQEALEAHQWRESWMEYTRRRAAADKARNGPYVATWAPKEDPQERAQRERDIAAGTLPF